MSAGARKQKKSQDKVTVAPSEMKAKDVGDDEASESLSSSSSSDDGKSEGPVTEAKKKKGLGLVIPHPVQGTLNFLCTVLGHRTCLLRKELVHLLEVTHRIKGIILGIAQPLHDVFDVLLSFLWASHGSRNRTVLICR